MGTRAPPVRVAPRDSSICLPTTHSGYLRHATRVCRDLQDFKKTSAASSGPRATCSAEGALFSYRPVWIQSGFEPRRGAQRSTDFLQLHKDRNGPLAREVDQNLRGGRRRKEFYEQPPIGSGEITTMEATYPRNEGGLSLMLTFSLQMHRQIII